MTPEERLIRYAKINTVSDPELSLIHIYCRITAHSLHYAVCLLKDFLPDQGFRSYYSLNFIWISFLFLVACPMGFLRIVLGLIETGNDFFL